MKRSNLIFLFYKVFCFYFNNQFKILSLKINSVMREFDDKTFETEDFCDLGSIQSATFRYTLSKIHLGLKRSRASIFPIEKKPN
jgi:hypothetical protein